MLGNGAGNGFSTWPDFGKYSLFAVWENEDAAESFFYNHPLIMEHRDHVDGEFRVLLKVAKAHGSWDGFNNFQQAATFDLAGPVAVLTRAAVRIPQLFGFWGHVPNVSEFLPRQNGQLECAYGIGEWPLLQLATFTIWKSGQAMLDYAYQKNTPHAHAVMLTRKKQWFSEELFARFVPYRTIGIPV